MKKISKLRNRIASAAACVVLAGALLALPGCIITDKADFPGTWTVVGAAAEITFVISEDTIQTDAGAIGYSLHSSRTIQFTTEDGLVGEGTYEFNEDRTQLTLTQIGDDGVVETTVLQKVIEESAQQGDES